MSHYDGTTTGRTEMGLFSFLTPKTFDSSDYVLMKDTTVFVVLNPGSNPPEIAIECGRVARAARVGMELFFALARAKSRSATEYLKDRSRENAERFLRDHLPKDVQAGLWGGR